MRTIADIVRSRSQALLRRFHSDSAPPLTAAAGLADKVGLGSYGGGALEILPSPGAQAAAIRIWRAPNPDDCALWLPRSYTGWRARYFSFIERIYGTVDMAGAAAFDVDHLFNKARAPAGFLIRVEAIPAWVNRIHGATFERLDSASAIQLARRASARDHRKMTFVSALKLAGLAPPRACDDRARMAAAVGYFIARGWSREDVEQSLRNLLQVAEAR